MVIFYLKFLFNQIGQENWFWGNQDFLNSLHQILYNIDRWSKSAN